MNKLKVGFYVTYNKIYSDPKPNKRVDLISSYSKNDLLILLSLLNTFEKFDEVSQSLEWEDELILLYQLTSKLPKVEKHIFTKLHEYKKEISENSNFPTLFNRLQLLFAINEVLSSPEINEDSNEELSPENFIKYLLLVNTHLVFLQDRYESEDLDFSDWFIVLVTQAEYFLPFTPTLDLCRSIHLTEYFYNSKYGRDFHEYYKSQAERPIVYFTLVYSLLEPIIGRPIHQPPIFNARNLLEKNLFSSLTSNDLPPYSELMLLHAKKNSFTNISENEWLLLDKTFLMDNVFYKAINSFWFDYLKQKGHSHKDYYSFIGRFYEKYISDILKTCFDKNGLKTLDELKVKIKNKEEIELADFLYIEKENILLGEIKSTNFGSGFKYAENQLKNYKENKDRFKKDFGINQIAKSIVRLTENPAYFEISEENLEKYTVYPVLIFNERMIKTAMSNVEFQKLLLFEIKKIVPNLEVPINVWKQILINGVKVNPLTLMHTVDLEILEVHILEKAINIWTILDSHRIEGQLVEPFYLKVFQNATLNYPDYAHHKVRTIIENIETSGRYT